MTALAGFSISYCLLQTDPNKTGITFAFTHNYRLMYGDFEPDSSPANWILFMFSSLLMPLVMLNMLIAIMSDTYARVMGEIVPSDYRELNSMILE